MTEPTDSGLALAEHWLRVQGIELGPSLEVHPTDDMARADVQGCPEEQRLVRYLASGRDSWLACRAAAEWAGVDLAGRPRVLDFACGFGRFLRWLRLEAPGATVAAGDLLEEATAFVAETFGAAPVPGAYEPGDLELGGPYDLIWVGSLFSHLELDVMPGFVRALYGALAPRGVLLLTTHNPSTAPEAARGEEFGFFAHSESRRLPAEFYGTSYIAPGRFARAAAEAGVAHHACRELEVWNVQDLHVLSRAPLPDPAHWPRARFVRGEMVRAGRVGADAVGIGGHVSLPRELGAPEVVELHVEGLGGFPARVHETGADARTRTFEWVVEGPAALLPDHRLRAVATATVDAGGPLAFAGFELDPRDLG